MAQQKQTDAKKSFTILIAAGGTGGHLFPAIAVAEEIMRATNNSCTIEFIGTSDRIESTIVPKHGYALHTIPIHGLQKLFSLATLRLPLEIFRSIALSRKVIENLKADCVICAGAYLSYPVGIAASQLGTPLFLLESNAEPGKTIKRLAGRAEKIYTAFPGSHRYFPVSLASRIYALGNPVRSTLQTLCDKAEAKERLGFKPDKPTVLVMGGSLGARSINQAMQESLRQFIARDIQILWQTGKNYVFDQTLAPKTDGLKVVPFVDDMALAYSAADIVVSRAGATTIAELALARKPAILIPFPFAANDHQTANARELAEHGAAILLPDAEAKERLFASASGLLSNSTAQEAMARAIEKFARPDAARAIAASIIESCS
jgi:UDP-N-acetylglucosamine--N-acetylmuramyl-(pentapeptide) pyrophosphoryl-undecaprenol N-acetylglucosamine transferase